jgi:hypothetical protein
VSTELILASAGVTSDEVTTTANDSATAMPASIAYVVTFEVLIIFTKN